MPTLRFCGVRHEAAKGPKGLRQAALGQYREEAARRVGTRRTRQALLLLAAAQSDDVSALEAAIERDGPTVTGSRGQTRLHPAVTRSAKHAWRSHDCSAASSS
jgi:poly-gamma-glutamate capsule biosynthesis protein CapA/YwtB (metallophosphatase superfamily)